jgi:hypothetical protein
MTTLAVVRNRRILARSQPDCSNELYLVEKRKKKEEKIKETHALLGV